MALAQTKAATYIQENSDNISSHQVISLLMDGAIERASQALMACSVPDSEDLDVLMSKLIAIIKGLKNCLDLRAGGEIATTLEALYTYIIERLSTCDDEQKFAAIQESRSLIAEVKQGWDDMELSAIEPAQSP